MIPYLPRYADINTLHTPTTQYECDHKYFLATLEALQLWDAHYQTGCKERPVIEELDNHDRAVSEVQAFFNSKYERHPYLHSEHSGEAMYLLGKIVETNGVDGLYSFFNVLSPEGQGKGRNLEDEKRFRSILGDVFVPHFEPAPAEELAHGAAAAGHIAVSLLSNLIHLPFAAYSLMRYRSLRNERLSRQENPSLEVINNLLPLLKDMHTIAQHSIDTMNQMQRFKDRPQPDVPPINTRFLETALENVRYDAPSP